MISDLQRRRPRPGMPDAKLHIFLTLKSDQKHHSSRVVKPSTVAVHRRAYVVLR